MNKQRKQSYMAGIAMTLGLLALMAGCQPEPPEKAIAVSVRVMTAESQLIERVHSYMGTIDTEAVQKLSFPASGRIDAIDVAEGDAVEPDQVLAVLDPESVQLQLDASQAQSQVARSQYEKAKAGVAFARETYEKMETLYQSGAVSQFERDQAKLQLDTLIEDRDAAYGVWQQAQAGLEGAGKMADESAIRADGEGHVISVLNEPGEFVAAGYPVIVLRKPESRVRIFVSQKEIVDIQVGQNVRCQFYGDGFSGKVDWIAEVPDAATLTYEVQISLEDANLRLGTIVDVDVILKRIQAIQVPIASLMNDAAGDYVYVVEGDVIQRKAVSIKTIDNTFAEVGGLHAGDRVVVMGMAYVEAGQSVTVREMEE